MNSAEFIKTGLLNASNFESDKIELEQIHIATKWDMIEAKLQDLSERYGKTLSQLENAAEESLQTVLNDLKTLGFDI